MRYMVQEDGLMRSDTRPAAVSKTTVWTGRALSFFAALFLLFDAVMKLVKPAVVVDATVRLGYAEGLIVPIGIVLLVCTVLYVIPRAAVLGAILLTGYLGGAVATHVRAGSGMFPVLFPVIVGAFLWGGLYLRDEHLRSLIPWRS